MSIGLLLLAGWFFGVLTIIVWRLAWVAHHQRKRQRIADAVVRDYARMAKTVRPQMTEFERRRLLKAFNEKHANAELVELGRAEPQIRTVSRWKKAP